MVCTHTVTKYASWVLELIDVGYQVCTVDHFLVEREKVCGGGLRLKDKCTDFTNDMVLFAGESSGAVVCPSCHVMCRPSSIIENHFLAESVALAALGDLEATGDTVRQCGSCPDTAATSWCVDCAEFICDGCVQVSSLSNSMLHFALNYITTPTLTWYMRSICSPTTTLLFFCVLTSRFGKSGLYCITISFH